MYSYEDRMRAVAHYIKMGKRAQVAICHLGYPSKNALRGWCREPEHRLDLRVGFAPRRPKFTLAQKKAAVEHYRTHDRCISATMPALDYPCRAMLTAWVSEAFPEIRKAVSGRAGRPRYPEALKKANDIIKNLGVDLQLLSNRKKTLLVDALKELYQLPYLLAQLGLARSSYEDRRS